MNTKAAQGSDWQSRRPTPSSVTVKHQANEARPPPSGLEILLRLEEQARSIETEQELQFFIANESRKLVNYRQALVFVRQASGKFRVVTVSSLTLVDRTSPFVIRVENILKALAAESSLDSVQEFSLHAYGSNEDQDSDEYPFNETLWVPFSNQREGVFAGMLLTREQAWDDQQITIVRRLAGAYAHAWGALRASARTHWLKRLAKKKLFLAILAATTCAMFIPVSLTTLAPVEVVASEPYVSAAPLAGVIDKIYVDPNAEVQIGDLLYRFEDTDFRNEYYIAEQNVQVAAARLRQAKQSAFSATDQSHEIRILEAEFNRSQLEYEYAKERFGLVEVRADQPGIVMYSGREDWIGKPVVIGERVMRIADPSRVELRIDVSVKDSIALAEGARVRAYLDSDPLAPIDARLTSASYQASELPDQSLAYLSRAVVVEQPEQTLRIGQRGTAKIFGEKVSLFFYLFRRPIAATRQYLGL